MFQFYWGIRTCVSHKSTTRHGSDHDSSALKNTSELPGRRRALDLQLSRTYEERFTWLLRARAYQKFGYDPDGAFSQKRDEVRSHREAQWRPAEFVLHSRCFPNDRGGYLLVSLDGHKEIPDPKRATVFRTCTREVRRLCESILGLPEHLGDRKSVV